MGSGTGVTAIRDISTHTQRKSQNVAENVNEVNLSKTEKGRGLDHVQETLARRQKKFSIIKFYHVLLTKTIPFNQRIHFV